MNGSYEESGLDLKQYMEFIVDDKIERFKLFTTWTKSDRDEFRGLLDELKDTKENITTKEKGDRLERLVEFIIKKTYFFEVYKNIYTETNEIDEVIVLSDRGKQALDSFGISRDMIPIEYDMFLGECKNYKSNLGVTYVGKFYSLLTVTGMKFGVIFTCYGLTGESEGYKDAYGLTKVLRMIEKSRNPDNDFYILTFTLEDYEKLLEGISFFDIVKAKKMEMQLASDYTNFLTENKHAAEEEVKTALIECSK